MEQSSTPVTVTEADHQEAKRLYGIIRGSDSSHVTLSDGDILVQAFARHRLAALAQKDEAQ